MQETKQAFWVLQLLTIVGQLKSYCCQATVRVLGYGSGSPACGGGRLSSGSISCRLVINPNFLLFIFIHPMEVIWQCGMWATNYADAFNDCASWLTPEFSCYYYFLPLWFYFFVTTDMQFDNCATSCVAKFCGLYSLHNQIHHPVLSLSLSHSHC